MTNFAEFLFILQCNVLLCIIIGLAVLSTSICFVDDMFLSTYYALFLKKICSVHLLIPSIILPCGW